jgi:uncharacterized protein (DUF488 family)
MLIGAGRASTGSLTLYTVGHSTRPLEEFVALLAAQGVAGIADVRRFPASRRHPHFAREALAATLGDAHIAYDWLPELGGRRKPRPDSPHVAWRSAAFRAYADHMDTPEFVAGLNRLCALGATRPTALLCAEAVPWRCHRQLIADALVTRGHEVRHILTPVSPEAHRLSPHARLDGQHLVYDRGQLSLPR